MPGFAILAAVMLAVGICGFISCVYIIDERKVRACRNAYLILSAAGVVAALGSFIVYFSRLGAYTGDDLQVIKDIFFVFFSVATVLFFICFAVTGISALVKSRMQIFIPLICGMWSSFILFWAFVCTKWSAFPHFSLVPYITVYAVFLCTLLLLPSLPLLFARCSLLANKDEVQRIITERKVKKERARLKRERKRLTAEKRKRLKKGNKK